MPYFVSPAEAYKRVVAGWVSPAGAWKRVVGRWVGVGGVWRKKFTSGVVRLFPATVRGFCYTPDSAIAQLQVQPNGQLTAAYSDQTVFKSEALANWFDPPATGVGSGFEIRAVVIAGLPEFLTGPARDTWMSLDTARVWVVTSPASRVNSVAAVTLEVAIRPVGAIEPLVKAQISLSATVYSLTNPNSSYGKGGGIDRPATDRFYQR